MKSWSIRVPHHASSRFVDGLFSVPWRRSCFFPLQSAAVLGHCAAQLPAENKAGEDKKELIQVRRLMQQMDDGSTQEQAEAVDQLQKFGPKAMPALPRLIKLFGDQTQTTVGNTSNELRFRALQAVEAIGPPARYALIETLHDENRWRQFARSWRWSIYAMPRRFRTLSNYSAATIASSQAMQFKRCKYRRARRLAAHRSIAQ